MGVSPLKCRSGPEEEERDSSKVLTRKQRKGLEKEKKKNIHV